MGNEGNIRVVFEVDERGDEGCAVGEGDFESDACCADVVRGEVV